MKRKVPTPPAITDRIPIALRAYAKPIVAEQDKGVLPPGKKPKRKSSTLPASPWVIVFDTETTTDSAQSLRFGTYQVRNKSQLIEAGIFYEPEALSVDEWDTLNHHAQEHELKFITRDEFAERVFYGIGYEFRACFVGFNLPFDISRIAIRHNSARTDMRGGFSFTLIDDKRKPNLQVKHVSQKCAFIRFAAPMRQLDNRSDRRRNRKNPVRRGHFIDLKTLAGALFAKSFSLESLSKFLKVANPKLEFQDFDGPITAEMATYAVRDVQATWESYVELIKRYEQLGISNVPPEKIYSEASIGKAYLKAMGITSWQKCQPDFPDQMLANIMSTYSGGRSEVRIRRETREVILCDFLSMYPTVCTLMGLWKFVTAQGMTWRDSTATTKQWLATIVLADLKTPQKWLELTTLVRVQAKEDIFPVRASYGDSDHTTIAANYLTADIGLWFTLADCVASKLLTGKVPEVLEAVTFAPKEPQTGLQAINISGNSNYAVNPATDDFYKRIIELRHAAKTKRDASEGLAWEILDTEQNALKIAANATSYGVSVEVNVVDKPDSVELSVLSGTDPPFDFSAKKVEETGPFFHPLLATLITGAARLMLALTERLVKEVGLEWAFCDTDSMAIAKPLEMTTGEFHKRVESVANWFDNLNPYDVKAKILKIEDVNFDHVDATPYKPLYCWAVSAKRYALFNLDADNSPVIRKASGHGLGHLHEPYTEKNPSPSIPKPVIPVHIIGRGFKLWQHDVWWKIIRAALDGTPDKVELDFHPAFDLPAISRYGATTPAILRWLGPYNRDRNYCDQVKPFGFLTALTANPLVATETIVAGTTQRRRKVKAVKPIAPFTRDPAQAAQLAFDRDTGLPVPPEKLKTFKQVLAQYHLQPESKFLNGNYRDRGTTKRRHIFVTGVLHIGKEANKLDEQMVLGIDEEANPDYGMAPGQSAAMLVELRGIADTLGRQAIANELGMSRGKLATILSGKRKAKLSVASFDELRNAASAVVGKQAAGLSKLRSTVAEFGLRATAKMFDVDPSNLKRRIER